MLVKDMIEKYILDTKLTMDSLVDREEIYQLRVLLSSLESSEYLAKAMTDIFDIDKDCPEVVYLFDMEKCMFWKQSRYGYTRDIYSAGLFNLDEAKKIVGNDVKGNTKIVYF